MRLAHRAPAAESHFEIRGSAYGSGQAADVLVPRVHEARGCGDVGDDPPRRQARAVPRDEGRRDAAAVGRARRTDRAARALGAGVGLQPGGRAHHRLRRRRTLQPVRRGRRGARHARQSGLRDGHVPPVSQHDGQPARHARELPHRARSRLRQPRARSGGGYRARIRAVEPGELVAGRAARARRRHGALGRGHDRRRRGLRRGRRAVVDGRRVPELRVPRLRHQSVRAAPRRGETRRSRRGQRVVPRSTRRSRSPTTRRSGSSRPSTASTT